MPMSPKDIQLLIDNATDNPQSTVEWIGNGGLKKVLTEINNNSVIRGVLSFADTTSMSLAGGTDGQYATCVVGTDIILYRYYPNVDNSIVSAVTSSFGGQWRPIISNPTSYIFSITELVAISDSEVVVTLPISQPSATYFVSIEPNNPFSANFLVQGYYIASKTTTSFSIKLPAAIGSTGTFVANIKISY